MRDADRFVFGCHRSTRKAEGIDLSSYESVMKGG